MSWTRNAPTRGACRPRVAVLLNCTKCCFYKRWVTLCDTGRCCIRTKVCF